MYYWTEDGRKILDGTRSMVCERRTWTREITQAVTQQLSTMDYAPNFQLGHPAAFELAARLVKHTPGNLDHVFLVTPVPKP